jgi:hypothetical protein
MLSIVLMAVISLATIFLREVQDKEVEPILLSVLLSYVLTIQ